MIGVSELLQQPKTIAREHQAHLQITLKAIEQSAVGLATQWQSQSHCDLQLAVPLEVLKTQAY